MHYQYYSEAPINHYFLLMEFYNTYQIQQLAPLLTLSLHDLNAATHLKSHLQKSNISNCVWDNSILKNRLLSAKYLLQFGDEESSKARIEKKPKVEGLHSALSPFNTESDLFPNGILSEKWFLKYTRDVPFAFVQTHLLGDDPSEDEALGNELAGKRQSFADLGVKYVAILLSDGDPIADQDRVDKLRLVSGLPRLTGIFYLNSDRDTLERDCGILASSLFSNLKAPAADFYSGVEARIKQRYKKYYTMPSFDAVDTKINLTPKFLEVRNMVKQAMILQFIHPHNVESCFTMLESSYERLIALTAEHADVFFSEAVSEHDTRIYAQFRQLLDVIAVHLIRGYLSTEEPTAALRKHEAHIANVLDLSKDQLKSDNSAWMSVQYQWLAELMQMVPPSVLSDLNLDHQLKQKSYQNSMAYFGGSTFHDTFNSRIITQSFLIYLKGFTMLDSVHEGEITLSYLKKLDSTDALQSQRLQLLDKAKEALEVRAKDNTLHILVSGLRLYLDWLTAEEYYLNGKYSEAEELYLLIIKQESSKSWSGIRQLLSQRLLLIYKELGNQDRLLKTLVEVASQKKLLSAPAIAKVSLDNSVDLSFDGEGKFFDVDVNLFNKNLKKEFFAFDTIVSQLNLKSSFDLSRLERLISNSEALLTINKIEVNYEGRSIVIQHSDSGADLDQIQLDGLAEYKADFSSVKKGRTVQILEEVTKPGKYKMESIEIYSTLQIKADGKTVTFGKSELHNFLNVKKLAQSFTALAKDSDGSVKLHVIRTQGLSTVECTVQPYKPEVSVELPLSLNSIIMGEKIELPLDIIYSKAPHLKATFSSLSVQVRSRLLEGEQEQDYLIPQTNWKDLKDDENLNILELFVEDSGNLNSALQLSIRRPPSVEPKLDFKLVIELQLIVGEANKSMSVYDLRTIELPVLAKPFGAKLDVIPRYREDPSFDMKNPFILSDRKNDADKNFSMPLPSWVWAAEARFKDKYNLIGEDAVKIKQCHFTLRSKNPEVDIETLGESEQTPEKSSQLFVTSPRHRFAHHLIGVVVSATYIWTRGDDGPENEFETAEWEVDLPLQNPRVLLFSVEKQDGKAVLKYVIENPTSRIFTFTTTLSTEESALRGVDWYFDDKSNIVPMKQGAFPVLPFSRHEMVFTGRYEVDDKAIDLVELPRMQVYDLNYKVSLATLPVIENVVAKDERLYMKN